MATQDHNVSVLAAILNTLHHPQDDKKNWTVIPGNDFSEEPSMFSCTQGEAASITITWMEDFDLTLNFEAVSNVVMQVTALPSRILMYYQNEDKKQWSVNSMQFEYMNAGDNPFNDPKCRFQPIHLHACVL